MKPVQKFDSFEALKAAEKPCLPLSERLEKHQKMATVFQKIRAAKQQQQAGTPKVQS